MIQLIQIAVGRRMGLSFVPIDREWAEGYETAINQAVAGVCFVGVKKLMERGLVPEDLYYDWLSLVVDIQKQNALMDQRTTEVWQMLKDAGLVAVVLKGQGIAMEYGSLATLRQSGDIDIWVKGGYRTVCGYVQRTRPSEDVAYHRFHYDLFADTEVELHHRPTLMRNLLDDRKLARWYNSFGADSFEYLEEKGFAVPSAEFNRIFLLTHIYRHFLFEGVGLRQVMDLYFVLKNCHTESTEITEIGKTLKSFRMLRFAEALMWMLHTQFGLEEKYLICGMNEKEGRFLLDEIMQTGNFGYDDQRYQYKRFFKLRHHMAHGSHLLLHYPSEVIWTPIWLVYHWFWKRSKIHAIRKRQK